MGAAVGAGVVGLVPRFAWTRFPAGHPAGDLGSFLPGPPRPGRRRPPGSAVLAVLVCLAWLMGASAPRAGGPLGPPLDCESPSWVTAWQASVQPVSGAGLAGETLRMVVHPEVAGSQVRVRLSNRFGATPLVVASTAAGRSDGAAGVVPDTNRPVTFTGHAGVTLAPGADVVSDPVQVAAEPGTPLAVSLYVTAVPDVVARHPVALQTSYLAHAGDATMAPATAYTTPVASWLVLTGLDVLAAHPVGAVVVVGDSITDGVGSPLNAGERWSDALAGRLQHAGGMRDMSVLNAGLSGNRLVAADPAHDLDSPIARFGPDVAAPAGATDVVLNIGNNDIAAGTSAATLIEGIQRYAERARAAGKRVFLTTVTPATLGPHGTPSAIRQRDAVNQWIRDHGREVGDGVFDFAAVVADPARPSALAPGYDAGDGLHLSPAGYRALAGAVVLDRLSGSPCAVAEAPSRVVVADS